VTEPVGRPAYQEVASDLRRRIAAGEFPVGSAIPSTAKLTKAYGVSSTVVRAAITQLRGNGLVIGQPGKGVFVRATPEAAAERAASLEAVAAQVGELRAELRVVLAHLADLYAQLGKPLPEDLAALSGVEPPSGSRSGG
jgi:GntR family transcriptional regulator